MTNQEHSAPDKVADLSDLKKRKKRDLGVEPLRATSQIMADSLGGLAEAWGQAFRSFSEQLGQADLSSGILEGYLAGNVVFFEQLARTASHALATVRERRSKLTAATMEKIDYDRLAKLIAEELRQDKRSD